MTDLSGQTLLNRFRIISFLGRGGMADVYKVWDEQRAVFLAMKLLRDDLAEDRVFLRRFRREAQTLARLQHPHIVRFYGLEQDGPLAFMLMAFIEGAPLRREIYYSERGISPARILEIMSPVCSALYFAHNNGMVHCDIKPGNILIDQGGDVYVSDFGIARMTDSATSTMVGMGTPAYIAPEQAAGQEPTPKSDIYSLGIVLYEMLTGGERPFTGEHARTTGSYSEKIRWEQVHLKPPSPKSWNPNLSPQMEAVVMKCLNKEQGERFESALDLFNALISVIGADSKGDVQYKTFQLSGIVVPPEKKRILPDIGKILKKIPSLTKLPTFLRQRSIWLLGGFVMIAVIGFVVVFGESTPRPQLTRTPWIGRDTETVPAVAALQSSSLTKTQVDSPTSSQTESLTSIQKSTLTTISMPVTTSTATPSPSLSISPSLSPSPTLTPTNIPAPTLKDPCVVYYDGTELALKYSCRRGTDWAIQVVENTKAGYASLVYDKNGHPHISYYDLDRGDLKYAHWSGSDWKIHTIDGVGNIGSHTNIAWSWSGDVHITYYDLDNDMIKYAWGLGNDWEIETITSYTGGERQIFSFILARGDMPLLSYYSESNNALTLARRISGKWQEEIIDRGNSVGLQNSLVLDKNGHPAISYLDGQNAYLKYARWTGSKWEIQIVDKSNRPGFFNSLAFDSEGHPLISYYTDEKDDLMFAWWNGSSWDKTKVDSERRVGWYSSLAIDALGKPFIVHYDRSNGNLKFSFLDFGRWENRVIEGVGDVGPYPCLKMEVSY